MIWRGISFQGLVPPQAPLFVDEMCKKYDSTSKTVKANTYAQMIKNEVRNGVDRVFPNGDAIFQDDGASIHRLQVSLEAVSSTFSSRVSPKDQASKMADVWPIANIWSIVKTKLDTKNHKNLPELKSDIKKIWREINGDKEMLRRMMASIPRRLAAVIQKKGDQIRKNDY